MVTKCNVLILGGGIAGSTCAAVLDQMGVKDVFLVEKSKRIGFSHSQKVDFAEDKGLKKLLKKYSLPVGRETNVSRWYAPNYEMFELKSKINDIWFKRGNDDSYETRVLKKSNVNIFTNTEALGVNKNRVVCVNRDEKKKIFFKPRFVVNATGNFSPFLNEDKKRNILKMIYAKGLVFDKLNLDPGVPHVLFDDQISNGSYLFMVQSIDENTGYLAYGSVRDAPLVLETLKKNKIVKSAVSNSKTLRKIEGSVYVGKPCSLVSNNVLSVGDAANLMDPFLNYGVTNAVKSGVFAAVCIAERGNVFDHYKKLISTELLPELKKQLKMRRLFDQLNQEELNFLIELFKDLNENENIEELFSRPSRLITKLIPYFVTRYEFIKILFKGMRCLI